jgi:hypothetical protein
MFLAEKTIKNYVSNLLIALGLVAARRAPCTPRVSRSDGRDLRPNDYEIGLFAQRSHGIRSGTFGPTCADATAAR